jgi:hypothetical protein
MLAGHFCRHIAKQVLCAAVPSRHASVGVQRDDRVAPNLFHQQTESLIALAQCLFGQLAFNGGRESARQGFEKLKGAGGESARPPGMHSQHTKPSPAQIQRHRQAATDVVLPQESRCL